MKNKISIIFFLSLLIPNLIFSQKLKDFKVFLESFKYENKKDTLLMLGNLKPPGEFGCGTGAVEYAYQINSFRIGKGKSIKNLHLLKKFSESIPNQIFWYYLYGSIYKLDKENKETTVFFKDDNFINFLKNVNRLNISFEKINNKNIIYYCSISNLKKKKIILESYYLKKENGKWKLDKVESQAIDDNFEYVYPNNS